MTHKLYVTTLGVVLVLRALAQAQTFTTLYNFTGGADGGYPYAGLIRDSYGNLSGTAEAGAPYQTGVVFEVDSAGIEGVLYNFDIGENGTNPYTPLIQDSNGNLYGTAAYGGSGGGGTVFKLDTAWNGTVLHTFTGGTSDGCYPYQGLVMGNAHNLYGTTYQCGASGYGTVFKVTPKGSETVLHSFAGGPKDGESPFYGQLLLDKAGNLYGVTRWGGSSNNGVVYRLSKNRALTVLHSFAGGTSDGCFPRGTVAMDAAGNLYGTAAGCGAYSNGTVWKLSKNGTETILHNFAGSPSDGNYPYAGVVLDAQGNLYGNTFDGGAYGWGTVWELSKRGTLTLLHSFAGTDGGHPYGEILHTDDGTLYGTTYFGGSYEYGTVWSYVP